MLRRGFLQMLTGAFAAPFAKLVPAKAAVPTNPLLATADEFITVKMSEVSKWLAEQPGIDISKLKAYQQQHIKDMFGYLRVYQKQPVNFTGEEDLRRLTTRYFGDRKVEAANIGRKIRFIIDVNNKTWNYQMMKHIGGCFAYQVLMLSDDRQTVTLIKNRNGPAASIDDGQIGVTIFPSAGLI